MAKLLFITQKVDKDDDVLGVYHEWIAKLAERIDKISVICLYRGRVDLPANISVYSLGKDKFPPIPNYKLLITIWRRILYIARFYNLIWKLRKEYNLVFVHMNQEYAVLGGAFWKALKKKIFFWYNHPLGNMRARLAIEFADTVFYTSPYAFAARYKKAAVMPVGVNTNLFRRIPKIAKKPRSILFIGRISPIKKLEILLRATEILLIKNIDFTLTVAGEPSKLSEYAYAKEIKKRAQPLIDQGLVSFVGAVPNYKTPELYNSHEICVNMTPSGSFDKTILEAMSCETPVIISNQSLRGSLPEELMFDESNASDLAGKISGFLDWPANKKEAVGKDLRQIAVEKHSLEMLIDRLTACLESL